MSNRALLLIDPRDLALVHQGLGDAAADAVLREIAVRLRRDARAADPVCRGPAGEFAVLLTDVRDATQLAAAAGRLMRVFDRPFSVHGTELVVQGFCGIALERRGGSDALLREAEAALAAARKGQGPATRHFEPEMADKARRSLEIDRDLRRALASDELRVFYQPIVDLGSGELAGFEALVRWQPQGSAPVLPAEFLSRAEESGIIVDIDRFVLREACAQLGRWAKLLPPGNDTYVAVNLSTHDLLAPELVRHVSAAIADSGIAPGRLRLEITESSMAGNPSQVRAALMGLRELGCVLAVDDFGTGWSSLSYLQQFPVQAIKIDRAFVKTIKADTGHELAAAAHAMATAMSLGVVAEGIEDRIQYRRLRDIGVRFGQGYHFSSPVSAAEATRFLLRRIPDEPSRPWSKDALGAVGPRA